MTSKGRNLGGVRATAGVRLGLLLHEGINVTCMYCPSKMTVLELSTELDESSTIAQVEQTHMIERACGAPSQSPRTRRRWAAANHFSACPEFSSAEVRVFGRARIPSSESARICSTKVRQDKRAKEKTAHHRVECQPQWTYFRRSSSGVHLPEPIQLRVERLLVHLDADCELKDGKS